MKAPRGISGSRAGPSLGVPSLVQGGAWGQPLEPWYLPSGRGHGVTRVLVAVTGVRPKRVGGTSTHAQALPSKASAFFNSVGLT